MWSGYDDDVGVVELAVTFGAALVSFLSCGWLLLCHRPLRDTGRRLFPKQLKLLAAVDLVGAVFLSLIDAVRFGLWQLPSARWCWAIVPAYWWMRMASVLTETHIAAGVLCGWRRWSRGGALLQSTLWLNVALSALLACVATLTSGGLTYPANEKALGCVPGGPEYLSLTVMTLCFVITVACYVCAFASSGASTENPRAMAYRRTLVYPINFWISYGPSLLFSMAFPGAISSSSWLITVADALEGLNGCLNVTTYMLQSSATLRRNRRRRCVETSHGGSAEGNARLAHALSMHVCFDPTEVSSLSEDVVDSAARAEGEPPYMGPP